MLTQFLARHNPDSTNAKPRFMKKTRKAVIKVGMDTMWTLITAFLVFFMNLGFALVESGLCRAKNCVNILFKNYIVFSVSSVAFLLLGFGLMLGDGHGFLGMSGLWFAGGADNSPLTGD